MVTICAKVESMLVKGLMFADTCYLHIRAMSLNLILCSNSLKM